ncbi:MAG TPA: hypothetical protein VH395_14360 [Jatrophihabitantaceae bacterium]|jgi:hypothetical protein
MTLPVFEDQPVDRAAVRITRAGDGLSEALRIRPKALHIGDEINYLLRGVVTQVTHREKDDEITRLHTVEAQQITEVDAKTASRMLAAAARELDQARQAEGQDPLPEDD